ncbi:MAG: hypothetical protein ACFFE8_08465 [Candidatus Heimdallarchaeota archaeon]
MLERLKELEVAQDFASMIEELKKHETEATQAYTRLQSVIQDENILGILKALEEISVSITSLLRHCSTLLGEAEFVEAPTLSETSIDAGSSIPTGIEPVRDRDDVFSLTSLRILSEEFPKIEVTSDDTRVTARFWFISESGEQLAVERTKSEKETFGNVLLSVLNEVKAKPEEKFSVAPLGFENLLQYQFHNSIGSLTKSYSEDFTLIKLFN